MKQVTQWRDKDGYMRTQYGMVTYEVWCEKEVVRINMNHPLDARIVRNNHGKIAIVRDSLEENSEEDYDGRE